MSYEDHGTEQFLRILAQIIAVIMIARYALLIVENYVHFLPTTGAIPKIMTYIELYAPMALMICVGLSAVWTKSAALRLIFLVVCVGIVICTFFPGVRDTITNYVGITHPATETTETTTEMFKLIV